MVEVNYLPTVAAIEKEVFFETFGNKSRLELKNRSFNINKLSIGLQKFDDNNKQTAFLNIYLDLDKALVLANDILFGRLQKLAGNSQDIVEVYKQPGGSKKDGKILYRELSISKGRLWMIKGSEGPGKLTERTGGFAPDGKPTTSVSVGVDDNTIRAIALMIQNEYQAYRTAQWIKLSGGNK